MNLINLFNIKEYIRKRKCLKVYSLFISKFRSCQIPWMQRKKCFLARKIRKINAIISDKLFWCHNKFEIYSFTPDKFHVSEICRQDVEKFASRRAERGVNVQLVLFTNSPHVKHYATYRDVYVNTVCSFIHECLISPSPSRSLMDIRDEDRGSQNYDAPSLTKRVVLPHEATKQN